MARTIVEFSTDAKNRVERNIAPKMAMAVTIPVKVDGNRFSNHGVTIYICVSPFVVRGVNEPKFQEIVDAIVEQLEVREG